MRVKRNEGNPNVRGLYVEPTNFEVYSIDADIWTFIIPNKERVEIYTVQRNRIDNKMFILLLKNVE